MPCYDPQRPEDVNIEQSKEIRKLNAMLCGFTTALHERNVLESWVKQVDWNEAGVTKEDFVTWWENHQREDRDRIVRELRERNRVAIRKHAIEKLSPLEQEVLGIR